jgi:hypothetical protein
VKYVEVHTDRAFTSKFCTEDPQSLAKNKITQSQKPQLEKMVRTKTRQNPGLSPILVFFSDLEVELFIFGTLKTSTKQMF